MSNTLNVVEAIMMIVMERNNIYLTFIYKPPERNLRTLKEVLNHNIINRRMKEQRKVIQRNIHLGLYTKEKINKIKIISKVVAHS